MGIKKVAEQAKNNVVETPNTGAPATPNTAGGEVNTTGTGAGAGVGNSDKKSSFDAFKATGTAIREKMSPKDKALECSKSGAVKFVIPLANPAKPMKRVQNKERIDSFEVVGYRFEALEDIKVPVMLPKKGAKSMMDAEDPTFKDVKKGETFDLTLAELGEMITDLQYGGIFNGGGDEVILHITSSKSRNGEPLTVLKRRSSPIKDKLELIANVEKVGDKKKYTVKDEFAEKFGYLFNKVSTSRNSNNTNSKVGESAQDLAAAFRAYKKKK